MGEVEGGGEGEEGGDGDWAWDRGVTSALEHIGYPLYVENRGVCVHVLL